APARGRDHFVEDLVRDHAAERGRSHPDFPAPLEGQEHRVAVAALGRDLEGRARGKESDVRPCRGAGGQDDEDGGGDGDRALPWIGMGKGLGTTTSAPAPVARARTWAVPCVSRRVRITFSASPLLFVK